MNLTMNALSPGSIKKAVDKLEKYRKTEFPKKVNDLMQGIIDQLIETAQREYATSEVVFTQERIRQNVWAVTAESASGKVFVTFLEFGTGLYAYSGHPNAGKVEFDVWSGSWSEEHAKTWKKWLDSGKDPSTYPYNHLPRRGLLKGMEAARQYLSDFGRRARG